MVERAKIRRCARSLPIFGPYRPTPPPTPCDAPTLRTPPLGLRQRGARVRRRTGHARGFFPRGSPSAAGTASTARPRPLPAAPDHAPDESFVKSGQVSEREFMRKAKGSTTGNTPPKVFHRHSWSSVYEPVLDAAPLSPHWKGALVWPTSSMMVNRALAVPKTVKTGRTMKSEMEHRTRSRRETARPRCRAAPR